MLFSYCLSLSRLSGGEGRRGLIPLGNKSLSRLSGGEVGVRDVTQGAPSLSRLSGGEVCLVCRWVHSRSLSRLGQASYAHLSTHSKSPQFHPRNLWAFIYALPSFSSPSRGGLAVELELILGGGISCMPLGVA